MKRHVPGGGMTSIRVVLFPLMTMMNSYHYRYCYCYNDYPSYCYYSIILNVSFFLWTDTIHCIYLWVFLKKREHFLRVQKKTKKKRTQPSPHRHSYSCSGLSSSSDCFALLNKTHFLPAVLTAVVDKSCLLTDQLLCCISSVHSAQPNGQSWGAFSFIFLDVV